MDNNQHNNLYLTIGSAFISVGHFVMAAENRSILAWAVGLVAGCVSIVAGVMTIREKHLRIKELKNK